MSSCMLPSLGCRNAVRQVHVFVAGSYLSVQLSGLFFLTRALFPTLAAVPGRTGDTAGFAGFSAGVLVAGFSAGASGSFSWGACFAFPAAGRSRGGGCSGASSATGGGGRIQ